MSETKIYDGGPAYPGFAGTDGYGMCKRLGNETWERYEAGVSVRDFFAAHLQVDDRLVKCVRAMDDTALEVFGDHAEYFALYPESERDEHVTETGPLDGKTQWHAMTEVQKVYRRLELEARAIAIVRFMQADQMIQARKATR